MKIVKKNRTSRGNTSPDLARPSLSDQLREMVAGDAHLRAEQQDLQDGNPKNEDLGSFEKDPTG